MSEGSVRRLPTARARTTGAAVAERVLAQMDAVVATMGEVYRREIPEYAAMSPAEMTEQVLPTSRRAVSAFFASYLAGRDLTREELRFFSDSGRARLTMGIPLDAVLHAYRLAGRVTWDAVVAAVQPGEESVLAELAGGWMDFIDRTSSAVARAYLAASHERLRALDARRRELLEALLTASDPAEVAAVSLRFSTVLAAAYVPVLVAGDTAAARIDALLAAAPAGTLGGHRGDRVLLLVPAPADLGGLLPASAAALVAYGSAAPPGEALLAEVTHVEALLSTAVAEGVGSGSYGPDDLLVEQLLLGNERVAGALRRRVHDVLAARDPSGALVSTLRAYLTSGSIPETARTEVVHANTVSYRLGRVRELTSLDPRVPADAAVLVLGLGVPR
jgi:hypothetical protein